MTKVDGFHRWIMADSLHYNLIHLEICSCFAHAAPTIQPLALSNLTTVHIQVLPKKEKRLRDRMGTFFRVSDRYVIVVMSRIAKI